MGSSGKEKKYAEALKEIRKKLRKTQKAFAKCVGMRSISDYEQGKALPSVPREWKIEGFLETARIDDSELKSAYRREKGQTRGNKRSVWFRRYTDLCAYLKAQMGWPEPGSELGRWVRNQRRKYLIGKGISMEHAEMLDKIGMEWKTMDEVEKEEADLKRTDWMLHYCRACESLTGSGLPLQDPWITRQLRIPHSEEEAQKLKEIGIRLVSGKSIRDARKGFSRKELSEVCGISENTLYRCEKKGGPEFLRQQVNAAVREMEQKSHTEEVFFTCRDTVYMGIGNGRTILVKKGTEISETVTKSFEASAYARLRKELTAKHIIENGRFTRNYTFASPSKAASVLSGRQVSSNNVWKNREGKTWYEIWP